MASEIKLLVEIENHYEEIDTVVEQMLIAVPFPPDGDHQDDDWSEDHVFVHTGTGYTTGESWYFVKVLESDHPAIIPTGTEWEFGT